MNKTIFRRLALVLCLMLLSCGAAVAEADAFDVETHSLERDGQKIYGELYLPREAELPMPLVIFSHGLGSNHHILEPYARYFAESGMAAYVFDYIGGSEESLSDGAMTQMSVLTEAEDLNAILDHFLVDSRFGEDRIILFGGSQGGFVSAYVAANRPGDVAGLIALYPAFNLQDICRKIAANGIGDTVRIGDHIVGRIYVEDMLTFDIYQVLRQYTGPSLLFHGTADPLVPEAYAHRAEDALPDAKLEIIEGAGHGFQGEDLLRVAGASVEFVEMLLNALDADVADAA